MATPSSATSPWMAIQAALHHRGQYGLPRESMTLVGPPRQPGDYPLTEGEIDEKIAAGWDRPGADPKIMTPAEEAEYVRNYQYLAGKPTEQEIEAAMAKRDREARDAEEAVLQERDKALAEEIRVREKEFADAQLREERAEKTFVHQQEASQAHYEAKVLEQITEQERARREATLLSQEEMDRANVEAQEREEKTRAEIAAREREFWGERILQQFEHFGFGAEEIEPLSANFEPWGGAEGTEEASIEEIRDWETAKAQGFPPGPDTGETPRPEIRNAFYNPGEIVDTFA